jgi:hypothetical protein
VLKPSNPGFDGTLLGMPPGHAKLSAKEPHCTADAWGPPGSELSRMVVMGPGGRSGKHPCGHPTEQFAFILEGEVTLTLGPDEHNPRQSRSFG